MLVNDIRKTFLDYFAAHEHEVVASSSLVPHNDPSLLFTNAGMVQFQECVHWGRKPCHPACCDGAEMCARRGKHNDLENVGHTARHHTFF